jgi:2,4-diacetylphloroglucinol hydrolase
MVRWWFWWHSVEPERYALWFPPAHFAVRPSFAPPLLARPDLPDTRKWLGATHRVVEFVGARPMALRTTFVSPARYGLPWARLRDAGYEAAVCAELHHAHLPMRIGDFLHLWRRSPDGKGLELRSRYWLGSGVRLELFGLKVPLDYLGDKLGIKKRMAGENVAYEHFMHDKLEFTILASFLPELYHDYQAKRLGGY